MKKLFLAVLLLFNSSFLYSQAKELETTDADFQQKLNKKLGVIEEDIEELQSTGSGQKINNIKNAKSIVQINQIINNFPARNLTGELLLGERLRLTNDRGILWADANSFRFLDLLGNELSYYGYDGARIGHIRITTGTLESTNYSPGVSGFRIKYTGETELSNTIIRGTITADAGTIGGWEITPTQIKKSGYLVIDSSAGVIRTEDYTSGPLGKGWQIDDTKAEFQNIIARGKITTSVFEKDTISAVNGIVLISKADVLTSSMTSLDSSPLVIGGDTTFSVNEVIRIKDGVDDEWMLVNSVLGTTYTVTRDLVDSYTSNSNPTWQKGTAVVSMGEVGKGFILFDASSVNSPVLQVYKRNSTTYNDYTEIYRIGNLNGYMGISSELWGFATGDYSGNKYIRYDPTNGMIIRGSLYADDITAGTLSVDRLAVNSITLSKLNFTPLVSAGTTGQIVATINATTEGVTISANKTAITTTVDQLGQSTTTLKSEIDINAGNIILKVSKTDVASSTNSLQSEIDINAGNILLKVAKGDVINQLNISTEGVKINTSKLAIAGITDNLVLNPSFEDGTNCWGIVWGNGTWGQAADPTECTEGSYGLYIWGGGFIAIGSRAIALSPGDVYVVRIKYRGIGSWTNGFGLNMNEKNSYPTGDYVTDANCSSYTAFIVNGTPPSSWGVAEFTYIVPAGGVWGSLTFYVWTGSPSQGYLTVDEVEVRKKIGTVQIEDGAVTLEKLNFTAVTSTDVVASINASAEGITINANKISISGQTEFSAGYDPTIRVSSSGGSYDSASSGARVRIFPDANTGVVVISTGGTNVFEAKVGGANAGDITLGDLVVYSTYTTGAGVQWDEQNHGFIIRGDLYYQQAMTRYYYITPLEFVTTAGSDMEQNINYICQTVGDISVEGVVHLPNGAIITELSVYWDGYGAVTWGTAALRRTTYSGGTPQNMAQANSSGQTGYHIVEDATIDYATIDNTLYKYSTTLSFHIYRCEGIIITYTLSQPLP